MKKLLIAAMLLLPVMAATAKKKDKNKATAASKADSSAASKKGPQPYKKVITDKAITKKGLFTVHQVDDKWYFEIPDSLMNREMMVTTRYSKIAGGGAVYAGELENQQTIEWEKGPNKNVFLRVVTPSASLIPLTISIKR